MVFKKYNSLKSALFFISTFSRPIFPTSSFFRGQVLQGTGYMIKNIFAFLFTIHNITSLSRQGFAGSRFFRVQDFQGPRPRSGPRFWKKPNFSLREMFSSNFYECYYKIQQFILLSVNIYLCLYLNVYNL